MENRKVLNTMSLLGIIAAAVLSRFIPHPPNVAPIAALALFSGAHLDKKTALIVPLSAMIISDIFLGFHATIPYVYTAFCLTVGIGFWLKKYNGEKILAASLVSSVSFFIITNFGVWASSALYAKNTQGLLNAYAMGLPFFKNTLFGDIFYSFFLFYGFHYAKIFIKKFNSGFEKTWF